VQAVLPDMLKRGQGTILVSTGASSGPVIHPPFGNIAAGSAALRNWILNLHAAVAPQGIYAAHIAIAVLRGAAELYRVRVLLLGPVDHDLVADRRGAARAVNASPVAIDANSSPQARPVRVRPLPQRRALPARAGRAFQRADLLLHDHQPDGEPVPPERQLAER
jgi:hypothetical protein